MMFSHQQTLDKIQEMKRKYPFFKQLTPELSLATQEEYLTFEN